MSSRGPDVRLESFDNTFERPRAEDFGRTSDSELLQDSLPRFLLTPGQHPCALIIRSTLQIIASEIGDSQIGRRFRRTGWLMSFLFRFSARLWIKTRVRLWMDWRFSHPPNRKGDQIDAWRRDSSLDTGHAFVRCSDDAVCILEAFQVARWLCTARLPTSLANEDRTRSFAAWPMVAIVAAQVGYSSQIGFRHAFKRFYGNVTNGCCVLRDDIRGPRHIRRLADGERQSCISSRVYDRQNVPTCVG